MRLLHSHTSPYVRKVVMLIHELGLQDQVEIKTVDAWNDDPKLLAANPLSQVPTLLLQDGTALYDSPVICEYLDSLGGNNQVYPPTGPERWRALRLQALADGILDSALIIQLERSKRPENLYWDDWVHYWQAGINRALNDLDLEIGAARESIDIGDIAVASALGYLDFRQGVGEWRGGRPALAAWLEVVAERPSFSASAPPAG